MRHPFFTGALVLHALLLAGLYRLGPYKVDVARHVVDNRRIDASLEQARRLQMQHYVQRLQEMQRRLDAATGAASQASSNEAQATPGSVPLPDANEQLRQARALVERMERTEQAERAKELAKLLKISPEQALAKVQADDLAHAAKQATKTPADPATQAAQLEERAHQAMARRQLRWERQAQGAEVMSRSAQNASNGPGAHSPAGGDSRQPASDGGSGGTGGGNALLAGGPLHAQAGLTDVRNYARAEDVPTVDPASVRRGRGHILGAGGALATRVYLDRWNVVGPFAARGPRSIDDVYPPELAVDLDAVYAGQDDRVLHWQTVESATYPFVPPDRAENAIFYAWTELLVDRDVTVWLDIGADDDSKLWLDNTLIWHSGDGDKLWYRQPFYKLESQIAAYGLVEGRRRVTLAAGRHTLLFKLYNGIDLMFMSVVVTP